MMTVGSFEVEEKGVICPFKYCFERTDYCKHGLYWHKVKDNKNLFYCSFAKRFVKKITNENGD